MFLWFSCLPAGRTWNTRTKWNTCKTVHLFLSFPFSIELFYGCICIAHHQLYFTWYFRALQVFQDYRVTEDSTDRRCAHNNDNDNSSFKCIPCVQSSLNLISWCFLLQGPPGDPGPRGQKVRQINLQQKFNICLRRIAVNECFLCVCSGYDGKSAQGCQRRPGKPSFRIIIVNMNDVVCIAWSPTRTGVKNAVLQNIRYWV